MKVHKETPGSGYRFPVRPGGAPDRPGFAVVWFAPVSIRRYRYHSVGLAISKVDDYFELLLFYPGLRVRLKSSYLVREALPGYAFHGSKGSFIKPKTDVQEALLQAGKMPGGDDWGTEPDSEKGLLHTENNGQIIREYVVSLQGNYGEYYDGIYKAIRQQTPPPVTAQQGLDVIRVIEKGLREQPPETESWRFSRYGLFLWKMFYFRITNNCSHDHRIFVTGGTFDKEYNALTGELFFKETHLPEMLSAEAGAASMLR